MKKISACVIGVLCVMCVLLLSGCRAGADGGSNGEAANHVSMTEEETQLLCGAFSDEDRIKEGDLFSYEEDLLEEIRFGRKYLSEKYPDVKFQLSNCMPGNNMSALTRMTLQAEGDPELYELCIGTENDSALFARDTYYGALLRDECESLMLNLSNDCLGVWTEFPYAYGKEYNASQSLDNLLKQDLPFYVDGAFYYDSMSSENVEACCEDLKVKLTESGLTGQFWVYFVKDVPDDVQTTQELREYVDNNHDRVLSDREKIVIE